MRRFYRQFMSPGDLCFDIGANNGERARVFRAIGATTIAVEPQPECAARLRCLRPPVTVVEAAVGSRPGTIDLWLADQSVLATASRDWIEAVSGAGRFKDEWKTKLTVPMTTFDELIAEYGKPIFCKIDVEGYELDVLEGLGSSLCGLSFEFVPERVDVAHACIARLQRLGFSSFALSLGETLELDGWADAGKVRVALDQLRGSLVFGDVYARSKV